MLDLVSILQHLPVPRLLLRPTSRKSSKVERDREISILVVPHCGMGVAPTIRGALATRTARYMINGVQVRSPPSRFLQLTLPSSFAAYIYLTNTSPRSVLFVSSPFQQQ